MIQLATQRRDLILLAPQPETVSYSEFRSLVKANKVSDLMLYKDTIAGTLTLTGLEGACCRKRRRPAAS